jgi:hypothetical protein
MRIVEIDARPSETLARGGRIRCRWRYSTDGSDFHPGQPRPVPHGGLQLMPSHGIMPPGN